MCRCSYSTPSIRDFQRGSSMTKSHCNSSGKRRRRALSDVSPYNLMEDLSSVIASFPSKSPDSARQRSKSKSIKKTTYKHIPHSEKPAHLVAKRNERERKRVQAVNSAFLQLQKHVPHKPKHKRLSKFKTLKVAIEYIRHLQDLIQSHDDNMTLKNKRVARGHNHHPLSNDNFNPSSRTCHRQYRTPAVPPCSLHACNISINNINVTNDINIDYGPSLSRNEIYTMPGKVQIPDALGIICSGVTDPAESFNNGGHQSHNSMLVMDDIQVQSNIVPTVHALPVSRSRYSSTALQEAGGSFLERTTWPFDHPSDPINSVDQWHSSLDSANLTCNASDKALIFPDTRSHSATPDSVISSTDSWNNNSGISNVGYSPFQQSYARVRSNDPVSNFGSFSF